MDHRAPACARRDGLRHAEVDPVVDAVDVGVAGGGRDLHAADEDEVGRGRGVEVAALGRGVVVGDGEEVEAGLPGGRVQQSRASRGRRSGRCGCAGRPCTSRRRRGPGTVRSGCGSGGARAGVEGDRDGDLRAGGRDLVEAEDHLPARRAGSGRGRSPGVASSVATKKPSRAPPLQPRKPSRAGQGSTRGSRQPRSMMQSGGLRIGERRRRCGWCPRARRRGGRSRGPPPGRLGVTVARSVSDGSLLVRRECGCRRRRRA